MNILILLHILFFFTQLYGNKNSNLAGHFLSLQQLKDLKKDSSCNHIKEIAKKNDHNIHTMACEPMRQYLFWHQTVATTGLWVNDTLTYPYVPHWYSLWELAPKKGKGITLVLLDTGVAGYEICGQSHYKKHPDLSMLENLNDNLNCCDYLGFDSVIHLVKKSIQPVEIPHLVLEKEIITWINEYCFDNNTNSISNFFNKHLWFENNNHSNQERVERCINEITVGRRGIMPRGKNRFFTPVRLSQNRGNKVILEFLPIAAISNDKNRLFATHGTHIFGLINARNSGMQSIAKLEDVESIVGIAPNAYCLMIKMCNENGTSDKKTLIRALKKAQQYNPDIVNLSLKIDSSLSEKSLHQLETLIASFTYVVAASGNSLNAEKNLKEAYPARCSSIPFDVGSFSFDGYGLYPISQFSQYEQGVGPKLVAPGFNIVSTGVSPTECGYLFLSGTSMASALIAGFLALLLSEFKDDFTREQLLKVCYASTLHMHNTADWSTKAILGVLDMRTALFILHVCRAFKTQLNEKKHIFNFEKKFNNIVRTLLMVLYQMPRILAQKEGIKHDFVGSFADFMTSISKISTAKITFYKKQTLKAAISTFVLVLFALINNKIKSIEHSFLAPYIDNTLFLKLRNLLVDFDVDLFDFLGEVERERIKKIINE